MEWKRHAKRAATVLTLVLTASAGIAWAQCEPPDADTDGDGVCDSVDNCVDVPNPDQLDTYGAWSSSPAGAFGDACEPILAAVNVVKVKLRAGSSGTVPKGTITVQGDFILLPGQEFGPPAIAARVVDGIQVDQIAPTPGAAAAACKVSSSGRNIKCKQPGPQSSVQTSAVFKLSSTSAGVARVVRLTVKIVKLPLGGMAFSEPVTVTVTDLGTGLHRVGVIVDCAARNGQLTCREL